MHYVKCFDILGIETAQVPCIELQGVPNTATEGAVGLLGMNMLSADHEIYVCIGVSGNIYTWIPLKGESGTAITSAVVNDAGELIILLSNGTTINAGVVAGNGCFVNGVATDINFTGDPQAQINECKEQLDNINLSKGEGIDSIVQKYSGKVDETHYGNTSTGESAAIFGEANKNNANRALMAGKLNDNNGANSIVGGIWNSNNDVGTHSFVIGNHNQNEADSVIIGGAYNKATYDSRQSVVVGAYNETYASNSVTAGTYNDTYAVNNVTAGAYNRNHGSNNVTAGAYNRNHGSASIVSGVRNEVKPDKESTIVCGKGNIIDANNGAAFGYGLKVEGLDGKTVVGRYNAPKPNTVFEVGNGTIDNPSNAFEVYEDGTIVTNGILYHHDIAFSYLNATTTEHIQCVLSIYTNSSVPFTLATLFTHLNGKGRLANGYYRPPNGGSTYNINRIEITGADSLTVYCNNPNYFAELSYKVDGIVASFAFGFVDDVTTIL